MKKKIAALVVILCLAGTSVAFARGGYHGHHRGYGGGYHYRTHHHDGVGIAFGVLGGLLLGSALIQATAPPPRTVVYGAPYSSYPPPPAVRPGRVCFEERVVRGRWQTSSYDGRQVWVRFPYPVTERYRVPCY